MRPDYLFTNAITRPLLSTTILFGRVIFNHCFQYLRDGVVVKAYASLSVDVGFISQVESYQNTLKNGIHGFPAWRSAHKGQCGEQAGKLACCVLGQGT